SNATLHWILDAESVVECVAAALKVGGRFVVEMGGRGNIGQFRAAVHEALSHLGYPEGKHWNPKYFPTIGEYATLLEKHDLLVRPARLLDRPTLLEGGENGLRSWLEMFEGVTLSRIAPQHRDVFCERVEKSLRPRLYRDGQWAADYVRLRLSAEKR